jgi:hypothetical protein
MHDTTDTAIVAFPRPSEEDVLRLWRDFQAAVAACDEAVLEAQAAGARFLTAFKAREGRS